MKTGNTRRLAEAACDTLQPQWSPVMKTGNTSREKGPTEMTTSLNGARS